MAIDPLFQSYCSAKNKVALDPAGAAEHNSVVGFAGETVASWVEKLRPRFPKINGLCAGFIEAETFGAAADIWNDVAVIRIHASVPTILCNLMTAFLSHSASLQVHGETVQYDAAGYRISETQLLDGLFNNGRVMDAKPDWDKRPTILALALCNFIFFHEFVHIRNGHVDLFKSAAGLLPMEEMEQPETEGLTPLDRHAMEWDADKIAHWLSTDVALSLILQKPFNECGVEETRSAFWIFHLSLFLLFKLMELAEPRHVPVRVHPTPVVRMTFILTEAVGLADTLKIGPLRPDFAVQVIKTGEVAWGMITGKDVANVGRYIAQMNGQIEDGFSILKHWNVVRERLAPYNRGETELHRFV